METVTVVEHGTSAVPNNNKAGVTDSDLARIGNTELLKAIQLVEDAFKCQDQDRDKASRLFDRASIAFLQAIRSECFQLFF